jgi:hypothetical protein
MLKITGTSINPNPCMRIITPTVTNKIINKDGNQDLLEAIEALVLYICIIAVNLQEI